MANPEKDLAVGILAASGLSVSALGLRFDRVAVRVLADLRLRADAALPPSLTAIVTITAPIRLPAKTVEAVASWIEAAGAEGRTRRDRSERVHGNDVRLRLVEAAGGGSRLIGFVHNPGPADRLLDLAERWLMTSPSPSRPQQSS